MKTNRRFVTPVFACLAAVLLVGLGLNSLFGWAWADPAAALLIAVVAGKEGRDAWRGDTCCTPTIGPDTTTTGTDFDRSAAHRDDQHRRLWRNRHRASRHSPRYRLTPRQDDIVTRDWLTGLALAVAGVVVSWLLLIVLARRLPPGILRDLAAFIPDCVTTVRRLRADPRVPRRAKIAIIVAGLWVASPIDLIPEFIPVIGPLDDIVVVALALRYAARRVPRDVITAAWPGDTRLLQRLLGPAEPEQNTAPR